MPLAGELGNKAKREREKALEREKAKEQKRKSERERNKGIN